jgi:steroid Delta-isomerase
MAAVCLVFSPRAQGDRTVNTTVNAIVDYFEKLSPESLAQLGEIYDDSARFKDPFNDVQGLAQIRRIFSHMYDTLDRPRFEVVTRVTQGQECFLTWNFRFSFRGRGSQTEQCIRGATHLTLAPDGRVVVHRDYWDAAEELYEKLPLLGALMRWLKRRISS